LKRRKFIKKSIIASVGAIISTALYSIKIEPFWLELVEQKMPIKNLPKHLVGKKLMQISDIHVGKRFDSDYLIESFQKAKKYKPDFVVYTGDFVHYEDTDQLDLLKEVMDHAVLGKKGTVGVLGNHDYGKDWIEVDVANTIVDILVEKDIKVLRNEKINLNGLTIAGIDDFWGTNFYPEKVLPSLDNSKANVVLCHNPDVCDEDVWGGFQGWILSGHTHGGQVKPPFLPAPMLPVKNKKYSAGKIDLENGKTLYINRALGHLWQIRFNVRPEITVFTLEREA